MMMQSLLDGMRDDMWSVGCDELTRSWRYDVVDVLR